MKTTKIVLYKFHRLLFLVISKIKITKNSILQNLKTDSVDSSENNSEKLECGRFAGGGSRIPPMSQIMHETLNILGRRGAQPRSANVFVDLRGYFLHPQWRIKDFPGRVPTPRWGHQPIIWPKFFAKTV